MLAFYGLKGAGMWGALIRIFICRRRIALALSESLQAQRLR